MRLGWSRSSDAEARLEKWIAQQHERRVLAGEVSPSGPCPDEAFLRDLARKAKRIVLSDPRVDHAATCPTCMSRLFALRMERGSRRKKFAIAAGVAAFAILAASMVLVHYVSQRNPSTENMAMVAQTVNLWDAETVRGTQPGQLQSVTLPVALVRLTIDLPRHSASGEYLIAITRDQSGDGLVAEGNAISVGTGNEQQITAELDLRRASAGRYFLSTTHAQDQAAYYYPLQIR